ncbi:MAG: alpha/beta fold hydrolase [Kouleothrix sp.]
MANEPAASGTPLRRGRGLQLSTHSPMPEAPTQPDKPVASEHPSLRRGRGLQLSTQAMPEPTTCTLAQLEASAPLQRIRLKQGELAYRQAGDGPPLLLIHGWGASSRYWLGTLAYLAASRTCYAIDLPGFGASPSVDPAPTLVQLAKLVAEFTATLGLARYDLNGHSFGAAVAACLAAQQPDRLRRLVITSFGVRPNPLERTWLGLAQSHAALMLQASQPLIALARPWLRPLRPLAAQTLSVPPITATVAGWYVAQMPADGQLLQAGIDDLTQMDVGAHLACIASIGDPAVVAALRAVQAPTLFIGGDTDRVVNPDELRAAAALTRGSQVQTLVQCGHVPMVEQSAAYHSALHEFLEG